MLTLRGKMNASNVLLLSDDIHLKIIKYLDARGIYAYKGVCRDMYHTLDISVIHQAQETSIENDMALAVSSEKGWLLIFRFKLAIPFEIIYSVHVMCALSSAFRFNPLQLCVKDSDDRIVVGQTIKESQSIARLEFIPQQGHEYSLYIRKTSSTDKVSIRNTHVAALVYGTQFAKLSNVLDHVPKDATSWQLLENILEDDSLTPRMKRASLFRRYENNSSILHIACKMGKLNNAIKLIAHFGGMEVIQMSDIEGNTPLHLAVINDNARAVSHIVDVGGKFATNKSNCQNEIPLHFASRGGNLEIVKLLVIEGDETIDIPGVKDMTSLQLAVVAGHIEVVKFFLQTGEKNNFQKMAIGMNTAHCLALKHERWDIAKLLNGVQT
jgi:hypothetical protein